MTRLTRLRRGRDDRGQITLWMLMFSLVILFLGVGVGVEAWRIASAWRAVAGAADAAAAAGASGIDENAYRNSNGEIIQLDPTTAQELAYQSLDTQADNSDITSADATATTENVTVEVHAEIDLFVLNALHGPFEFTATATADPRPST